MNRGEKWFSEKLLKYFDLENFRSEKDISRKKPKKYFRLIVIKVA